MSEKAVIEYGGERFEVTGALHKPLTGEWFLSHLTGRPAVCTGFPLSEARFILKKLDPEPAVEGEVERVGNFYIIDAETDLSPRDAYTDELLDAACAVVNTRVDADGEITKLAEALAAALSKYQKGATGNED